MVTNEEELNDMLSRRKAWFTYFKFWQIFAWTLLIWVALGSAITAANIYRPATPIVALTVAAASAVLATMQPQRQADGFRRAWLALDLTIKKKAGLDQDLIDGLTAGESVIGDIVAQTNPSDRTNAKPPAPPAAPPPTK